MAGVLRVDGFAYTDRTTFPDSDGVVLEETVALDDGTLDLRVFVDQSVVEVYANELEYVVSCMYPPTVESRRYSLSATGGSVVVESADAYQLGAI